MRRWVPLLSAAVVVAVAAPAAEAAPRCSVPNDSGWHSCLSAGHRAVLGTNEVRLTRATPVLVVRLSACPADLISRRVALRTRSGDLIVRRRVTGKCSNGVARWRVVLHPNAELRAGTVIQSFWSRLGDEDRAPKVKLKAKP